ncbi:MAG: right-handed parallel beta-helix repeat-containing protein [Acidobacteriaceae bacterium]|nr:right-handed parallel beta-helix repeat-containing protein [Acidobacteriaceae bacterium]
MKLFVRAALFAASIFAAQTLSAVTVYVGSCGPAKATSYTTIQQAVTAVPPNSVVFVCPGTYPEQVTITKNVTLKGLQSGSADAAVITSPSGGVVQNTYDLYLPPSIPVAAQLLVQNAQSVNIANITVDGSNNQIAGCAPDLRGIYYQNASGDLSGVATRNQTLASDLAGCQSGEGIFVQSGYGSSGNAKVTIQGCSVHAFQKNGVTADGSSTNVLVVNDYISGQGPTTGAAENGVQVSDGAGGSVVANTIFDDIWAPDTSSDTGDAASGILIYASEGVTVTNNIVSTTQFGIVTVTDPTSGGANNPNGVADNTIIKSNRVLNTEIFDAIDACSNGNTIESNVIANATESGIHLDSSCGSTGVNNTVENNFVNESCAGILAGATPNTIASNNFFNVVTTQLAGNACPATPGPMIAGAIASGSSKTTRPRAVR